MRHITFTFLDDDRDALSCSLKGWRVFVVCTLPYSKGHTMYRSYMKCRGSHFIPGPPLTPLSYLQFITKIQGSHLVLHPSLLHICTDYGLWRNGEVALRLFRPHLTSLFLSMVLYKWGVVFQPLDPYLTYFALSMGRLWNASGRISFLVHC